MVSMAVTYHEFTNMVHENLTEAERQGSVVYAAVDVLPGGSAVKFPGFQMQLASNTYLAFVDQDPSANWGHAARYLVVDQTSGKITSVESRLPPFRGPSDLHWVVIYQAPSVPDAAVYHPQ